MNRYLATAFALALAGVFLAAPASAAKVRTGLWEVTVKTEMPGMPMAMPSSMHRYCVREKDLVPHNQMAGQHCKVLDRHISGDTISWRVQCTGNGGTTTGSGTIHYSGDTYHGKVVMNMPGGPNGPMRMIETMDGHRLGPCK